MYTHRPKDYVDPFELIVQGIEDARVYTTQEDIIYQDEYVTAFISSHWWPNNPGHVLIIPNESFENIYDLPDAIALRIHHLARRVSLALKEVYNCDGVSVRQHNEPAGDQDVWHYHLHVFPRYVDDQLYLLNNEKRLTSPEERKPYAEKLRTYFEHHHE